MFTEVIKTLETVVNSLHVKRILDYTNKNYSLQQFKAVTLKK